MAILVLGLILFIGVHSVRIVAAPWRAAQIARFGKQGWRMAFAVLSLLGIALIAYGYGLARREPVPIWAPPFWMAHVTALLTAVAFVFITAAFVPGNHFKQTLGHPFLCGVALWAFAHLLANGTLNAILLFGAFLVWASLDLRSERRRDREAGVVYPQGTVSRDVCVVAIGLLAWTVFVFWLHGLLIGVRPLG
ncbi:NnrU family protein [Paraburkholderia sp. J12]|uniref:NnrU family protein n=1 Tax=Paraburkholderia sp. J12 TaxID=2805432 RepID=UPI002ABD9844|nr:NnrU family protein [Paraburkholderia sp. J12]